MNGRGTKRGKGGLCNKQGGVRHQGMSVAGSVHGQRTCIAFVVC